MIEDPLALIREASDLGVELRADGNAIRFRPIDRLPDELALRIAESKNAVRNALDTYEGKVWRVLSSLPRAERCELHHRFVKCTEALVGRGHDRQLAEGMAFQKLGDELEMRYEAAQLRAAKADAEINAVRERAIQAPPLGPARNRREEPSHLATNEVRGAPPQRDLTEVGTWLV